MQEVRQLLRVILERHQRDIGLDSLLLRSASSLAEGGGHHARGVQSGDHIYVCS